MMKPFNLERSLAGEPVILRNGSKAYVQYTGVELIYGVDLGRKRWTAWEVNGSLYENRRDDDFDIVGMWPKEPLAIPDSFWKSIRSDVVAIAKDYNDDWFGYTKNKPIIDGDYWFIDEGEYIPLGIFPIDYFPDCEWRESLILRPSWTI